MIVAHLTSVHTRYDTRIFMKECRSLAAKGWDVSIVVADGKGDEKKDGVKIFDVGGSAGRLDRMIKTTRRVFDKALRLNADVYHLHDPELIPVGLKLKKHGKRIVFDAHEDLPKQLLSKPYLNPLALKILSRFFAAYERYACKRLDGIVTATPFIAEKFALINPNAIDINNFPMIGELDASIPWTEKQLEVCYVGGIGSIRGIREVIQAGQHLKSGARINLVGQFSEQHIESEVKSYQGWGRVNEYGFLDRVGVRNILGRSVAGLVTFYPLPNHVDAQPNKMFEYMSAGIPVIASNFPLWREIIEGNHCGICVDPLRPEEIAEAIDELVANPGLARQMGDNGRRAVMEKYNWSIEEAKLFSFYNHNFGKAGK